MLVTFTTDAYADITMFGNDALTMLKMMGHSGTVPSAILAADIPDALKRLTAALATNQSDPPTMDADSEPVVSLHNRGLPLINLLTAAVKTNSDVLWK